MEVLLTIVAIIAGVIFLFAAFIALAKLADGFLLAFKRCWWAAIICLFTFPIGLLVWMIWELIVEDEAPQSPEDA